MADPACLLIRLRGFKPPTYESNTGRIIAIIHSGTRPVTHFVGDYPAAAFSFPANTLPLIPGLIAPEKTHFLRLDPFFVAAAHDGGVL